MNHDNEIGGALNTVDTAQRLIGVFGTLKKITIAATALYVAAVAYKIFRNN